MLSHTDKGVASRTDLGSLSYCLEDSHTQTCASVWVTAKSMHHQYILLAARQLSGLKMSFRAKMYSKEPAGALENCNTVMKVLPIVKMLNGNSTFWFIN